MSLVVKNPPPDARDTRGMGLIPGSGRSRGGHGSPLQHACLENPMDRGAGGLHSIGRRESDTTEVT